MPGEKVVRVSDSELEGIGKGTLYISTHRLLFETYKPVVALVIELEDVKGARIEGDKIVVRGHDDRIGTDYEYEFTTPDSKDYMSCLRGACEAKIKPGRDRWAWMGPTA